MAFTEDPSWIEGLDDREKRLLWENPEYARRVASYLRVTKTDPGEQDPEITYDDWGQPSHMKEGDNWVSNPAFGINPNQSVDDPPAGDPPTGGLFSDQENYPGLRAQPHTTDADGNIQVWGIYKNAQGEWDWEVIATRDPTTGVQTPTSGAKPDEDSEGMRQLRSDYENLSTQLRNLIADAEEKATVDRESVYDTLYDLFVGELGLPESLMKNVMEMLIEGDSDLAVTQQLRASTEYNERFPVMAQRATLGLPRLSEATVLKMERAYRSSMRQAGLEDPPLDYMTQWLVGDVSDAELQTRIALAETAVRTANTETKQQLKDLYNIDDTDLLSYYLDPDEATDIFEARLQLEAAGISAASIRGAGAALGVGAAERLQASGVQAREVEQRLGRRAGLLEDLIGSEGLTADELAEGEFGTDLEAATELQRLTAERLSAFQGTGGVLADRGGITGLGSAST